ncbi:MAG: PhzF family phenazine biosynthesis protein [Rhodoferax sp.]
MKTRPFQQVDVFTDTPGLGNPLAVVLDAQDLTTQAMQRFARWTNLSETTFLLPPSAAGAAAGAHYRVRIFTPAGELPFAGHPTLGSAAVWRSAQPPDQPAPPELVQECAQGLVRVRCDGTRLAFAAPPSRRHAPEASALAAVLAALNLNASAVLGAQVLDNGPRWLTLLLTDRALLLGLQPDHGALKALGQKVGVAHIQCAQDTTHSIGCSDAVVTVRAFAAATGVPEDPVTGSLNASLAQWLMADGLAPMRYTAHQGHALGRQGRVDLVQDGDTLWVGGAVAPCIVGTVRI